MIGPDEIVDKLERWWPEILQESIDGKPIFPRNLKRIKRDSASSRLKYFDKIKHEQKLLIDGSKPQRGYGYVLEWKVVQTRKMGWNSFIYGIRIPTLIDYLKLIGREKVYDQFLLDLKLIENSNIRLGKEWLRTHVLDIVTHAGHWSDLLLVLDYFTTSHVAGRYYIRELPISVPTKFIETKQSILTKLLNAILPKEAVADVPRGRHFFERRFGLRYPQPQIRIRLLDSELAQKHFSGLTDLSLPKEDFDQLSVPFKRAIIVENKTTYEGLLNFLTLPNWKAGLAVFGSGFKVSALKDAEWLQKLDLLYWGDLDAHGLLILNQLRTYFPHLRTLLMDRATLDALPEYHVASTQAQAENLSQLTQEERDLYHHLNENGLRLEQERIPLEMVKRALAFHPSHQRP
ncbi:MAG: Wadjet anti-phage system protein JetD domain-containing protein [Bacteroidota bacterium]